MALAREGAELGGVHVGLQAAQAVPVLVAVTTLGKRKEFAIRNNWSKRLNSHLSSIQSVLTPVAGTVVFGSLYGKKINAE